MLPIHIEEDKMKRLNLASLALIVCALNLTVNTGFAQTLVSGNVSGTWTAARSPYIVTNHVTVPADSTLIIEPGVKVKFRGHYKFNVNGLLAAVGTKTDSIFFVRENPTEQNRWWAIRFENSGGSDTNLVSYCYFEGGKAQGTDSREYRGGAIVCYNSNIIVNHATFRNNQGIGNSVLAGGGAIYVTGPSYCIIEDSHFENNSGIGQDTNGGALLIINAPKTTVRRCSFVNNAADFGGALAVWGGGLITNCVIDSNRARYQGGGIYLSIDTGPAEIRQNKIRKNWTYDVGAWIGHGGGGIYIWKRGTVQIHHNLIIGNSTVMYGGGLNCYDSTPLIYNNTVYGNTASAGAGGLRSYFANPTGFNNIFWNNASTEEISGDFKCTYSDIQGGYSGTGNINANPLFINSAAENFYLQDKSPCIDAGDPNSPSDPDGTIADLGAFYFDQGKCPKAPASLSVKDVSNDQGGKVTVKWKASCLDTNVIALPFYSLWRALPEGKQLRGSITSANKINKDFNGPAYRIAMLNGKSYAWEWLANQPAHRFASYAYTAATLYDSMSATDGKHYFLVSAHTSDPNIFYDSQPDSGYSVDNLAPLAPSNLAAKHDSGKVMLQWDSNTEPDLRQYVLYRSASPNINPDRLLPFATSKEARFMDANPLPGNSFYIALAQDIHDNLSAKSNEAAFIRTGVAERIGEIPTAFALYQNHPNPFNPSTMIRYAIPASGHVTLKVFDLLGKEIVTLVDEKQAAGHYTIQWTPADLPSGVYVYCLQAEGPSGAGEFVETRKLVLMK
jgi:hypothetical protein